MKKLMKNNIFKKLFRKTQRKNIRKGNQKIIPNKKKKLKKLIIFFDCYFSHLFFDEI